MDWIRAPAVIFLLSAARPAAAQVRPEVGARHHTAACPAVPPLVSGQTSPVWFACQLTISSHWREPRVKPVFPPLLREAAVEGVVQVEYVVDERGRVDTASIGIRRSPHRLFTDAARAALMQWSATVPRRHGVAARKLRVTEFRFGFTDSVPNSCVQPRTRVRVGPLVADEVLVCAKGPVSKHAEIAR